MSADVIKMKPAALPAPPVAADLDARLVACMAIDVERLRRSGNGVFADGETFRAALLLWASAFHEVPAGSLPSDDEQLRGLAGLGREPSTWERVRGNALRGFVLCSDGRLYNASICDRAREALDSRTMSTPSPGGGGTAGKAGTSGPTPVDLPGQAPEIPGRARGPSARRSTGTGPKTPSTTTVVHESCSDRPMDSDTARLGDRGVRGGKLSRDRNSGTRLEMGWTPSPDEITYGRRLGLNDSQIDEIAEDMRIWAAANANRQVARKANWHTTFLGFLRREAKKLGLMRTSPVGRPERGFFRSAARAAARSQDDGE